MEFYSCSPNELLHYGVKGMKWGVIRSKVSKSRNAKVRKLKKDLKTAQKEAAEAKAKLSENEKRDNRKKIEELSDDELRRIINRAELERRYADLNRPSFEKKIDVGKKFLAQMLKNEGSRLATEALHYYAGTTVNRVTGKQIIRFKNKGG